MSQTIADVGEFGLIDRLNRLLALQGVRPDGLELGIGDDAALLRPAPGHHLAVTCDVLLEGRHFLPGLLHGVALGRRAMSVNLSDLAAMGAAPRHAFVALGLRGETAVGEVEDWYRGFAAALTPWGAGVAGGNMTRVEGPQFVAVTLIGEVEPGRALRRGGARPGDQVLVTGYPGQAAAGLQLLQGPVPPAGNPLVQAHLAPVPRVAEGMALAAAGVVHAAVDLSDGLVADLGHLCVASGVGARLWADHLPVSPALAEAASALGRDPLDWVLGASDDYELLLACPPAQLARARACVAGVGPASLTPIGEFTAANGQLEIVGVDGVVRPLGAGGWDHFRGGGGTGPRGA